MKEHAASPACCSRRLNELTRGSLYLNLDEARRLRNYLNEVLANGTRTTFGEHTHIGTNHRVDGMDHAEPRGGKGDHRVGKAVYESPEEAARGSRASADVLALEQSPDGRWAVAVVDKGRPGDPYLLQTICERSQDGWRSTGQDTNGQGYTAVASSDPEPDYFGIVTAWGRAPAGKQTVTIRWRGRDQEVPVENDYYLFVDWRAPEPEPDFDFRDFPHPV
jgi:hypothetical protein